MIRSRPIDHIQVNYIMSRFLLVETLSLKTLYKESSIHFIICKNNHLGHKLVIKNACFLTLGLEYFFCVFWMRNCVSVRLYQKKRKEMESQTSFSWISKAHLCRLYYHKSITIHVVCFFTYLQSISIYCSFVIFNKRL